MWSKSECAKTEWARRTGREFECGRSLVAGCFVRSEALDAGLVDAGDVLLFLAAGTGYTWAATVLTWQG